MTNQEKIRYPFPKKYLEDYVTKLFASLKRGECITSVWVATAGRRVASRFIVDNIELFEKQVPKHKDYLLVYIEPLDLTEESQCGYLRLMGKTFLEACTRREDLTLHFSEEEAKIFDDEEAVYSKLLEALKNLVTRVAKPGVEVVLFLGEIDELSFITPIFCNNLRSFWNRFDGRLHYVFLIKDARLIFAKDYFGEELGYLFFQNILYVPVSQDNQGYLIDYFEQKMGYKLTVEKRKIIDEMCDGHPYFLKLAVETLAKEDTPSSPLPDGKVVELIRANYEIRAVSERMIEILTERAKEALYEIATKKVYELPGEELKALELLGLVKKTEGGLYRPFCQLFQDAILKRAMPAFSSGVFEKKLFFDTKLNSLIFSGRPIEEKFTRQEYELLTYFLKDPDKVHSRDEIAEAIWGKESYEKYSDWAIDQIISKLRKKLGELGLNDNTITTVRGRGYKFSQ